MKKNRTDPYSDRSSSKNRQNRKPIAKQNAQNESRHAKSRNEKPRASGYHLHGFHPVLSALQNPKRKKLGIYATETAAERLKTELPQTIYREIEPIIQICERDFIDTQVGTDTLHQGILLKTSPLQEIDLDGFLVALDGQDHLIMILDQITDPHNIGAILRSCAIFGASALVVTERNAAPESPIMAKTASGALETIPVIRVGNLKQSMESLNEAGFWITGFAGEADQNLDEIDLNGRCGLVMGSEGKGMRRLIREHCDHLARIPMEENNVGSLNVSNAAAIGLYEAVRQRRLKKMT